VSLIALVAKTTCPICSLALFSAPQSLILLFLCRHVVHAGCVKGGEGLSSQPDDDLTGMGVGFGGVKGISGKIALWVNSLFLRGLALTSLDASASSIRANLRQGCPVCHKRGEGDRTQSGISP
jgi:hypothetical protein